MVGFLLLCELIIFVCCVKDEVVMSGIMIIEFYVLFIFGKIGFIDIEF